MKKLILLLTLFAVSFSAEKWKFGELTSEGYVGIPVISFSKTSQTVFYFGGARHDFFDEGEEITNEDWVFPEENRDGKYGGKLGDITNLKITLPLARFLSVYYESSNTAMHPTFYHKTDTDYNGKLRIYDLFEESFKNKS